jgi:hypothetical protein
MKAYKARADNLNKETFKMGNKGGEIWGLKTLPPPLHSSSLEGGVHFSNPQEVELLWLETVKTFADMTHNKEKEVARKADFFLQVGRQLSSYLLCMLKVTMMMNIIFGLLSRQYSVATCLPCKQICNMHNSRCECIVIILLSLTIITFDDSNQSNLADFYIL